MDYSPELSREYRGLRIWLPLKLYGVKAFRDLLDEKLDLTEYAFERISAEPYFEIPVAPELSVVAFRALPGRGDANDFNRLLLNRVNDEKRVFLSSTVIDEKVVLRLCVLNFRSHRDRVDEALESLVRNAALLRGCSR